MGVSSVQAIFPKPDITAVRNGRINHLIQYARKVEGDMYETANSRVSWAHSASCSLWDGQLVVAYVVSDTIERTIIYVDRTRKDFIGYSIHNTYQATGYE